MNKIDSKWFFAPLMSQFGSFMGQTTIQFIRNENKGDTALLYMSNPIGTITKPYHAVTVMH